MINVYKIKKYGAMIFASLFSCVFFAVGMIYYGFIHAVGLMFVATLLSVMVGSLMLKNPFSDMLEGKGVLAIDVNSTGILRFFIVGLDMPFVRGKLGKKPIRDIFDREAVVTVSPALKAQKKIEKGKDGGLTIRLTEEDYNNSRMAAMQYPCLLYNSALGSIVTKNFISRQEKEIFAEHTILYLNRNVEELTLSLKNFGRYVVDSLKPKTSFISGTVAFWVIIGFVVILAVLFGKPIIDTMMGSLNVAGPAVQAATNGAAVSPLG